GLRQVEKVPNRPAEPGLEIPLMEGMPATAAPVREGVNPAGPILVVPPPEAPQVAGSRQVAAPAEGRVERQVALCRGSLSSERTVMPPEVWGASGHFSASRFSVAPTANGP